MSILGLFLNYLMSIFYEYFWADFGIDLYQALSYNRTKKN